MTPGPVQGLPELIITVAGRRLPPSEVHPVASVQVRTVLGQPAQCVVTWRVEPGRAVAVACGEALRVEVGGVREPLFTGEVTVVESSYAANSAQEVRVRAYDVLHRLRKRQATVLHPDADLAGLARRLCAGTGLSVDGAPLRLGDVYQCARTDLDLLHEVCARAGVHPVVDGDRLRLLGPAGDGDPIPLELGAGLHSAELEVSQEPSFRSAAATFWNPDAATAGVARAGDDRARAAVHADAAPAGVGGGGLLVRADEVLADPDAAAALAQAELDARRAGEVVADLVADGDPRLRAGRRVRLSGVAASLEGVYPVTEAVHRVDGGGYETRVSTRPPPAPPARPRDRITLGAVQDVADPQGRGRVRARLEAYPDLVTGWAAVLVAAAGPDKGAVLLPEVGDTVLVLLPAGDPAQAVVLGGLYGRHRPPDAGAAGSRGGRYTLRTPGGQQVCLDGHARTLTLTDGRSEVVLGPDLLRITAATDLLLEAPGRAMRVRAARVDFEEAP